MTGFLDFGLASDPGCRDVRNSSTSFTTAPVIDPNQSLCAFGARLGVLWYQINYGLLAFAGNHLIDLFQCQQELIRDVVRRMNVNTDGSVPLSEFEQSFCSLQLV